MKVSIITATYNHEKFIAKCIESVLRQTYPNWEQIIVDDGSTDNTESIVGEYAAKDSRIKYIRKEHEGIMNLKNSYNLALDNSTGDLIAILEGDDYWPDYKLEVQVPYFKDENIILAWGKVNVLDSNGNTTRVIPPEFNSNLDQIGSKKLLFYGNYIHPLSLIIRKVSLTKNGGFKQYKGLPLVDFTTILSLIPYGDFKYIPDYILGYWVVHGKNVSLVNANDFSKSYLASYYYYKLIPKEIRSKFFNKDYLLYFDLIILYLKQLIYNFRKQYNLFHTPRNDD